MVLGSQLALLSSGEVAKIQFFLILNSFLLSIWFFVFISGIQHVITWIVCIVSGVVAIGGFFYSFTPIFFMDILYILIKFFINYISASGVIRFLSGLLFGRFLTGVIETHEDLPEIGAASCK